MNDLRRDPRGGEQRGGGSWGGRGRGGRRLWRGPRRLPRTQGGAWLVIIWCWRRSCSEARVMEVEGGVEGCKTGQVQLQLRLFDHPRCSSAVTLSKSLLELFRMIA